MEKKVEKEILKGFLRQSQTQQLQAQINLELLTDEFVKKESQFIEMVKPKDDAADEIKKRYSDKQKDISHIRSEMAKLQSLVDGHVKAEKIIEKRLADL